MSKRLILVKGGRVIVVHAWRSGWPAVAMIIQREREFANGASTCTAMAHGFQTRKRLTGQ